MNEQHIEDWPTVMWAGHCIQAAQPDCVHCWHVESIFVQTNPPQALEVCCWCSATRTTPIGFGESAGVHGAFRPEHDFILTRPSRGERAAAEPLEVPPAVRGTVGAGT